MVWFWGPSAWGHPWWCRAQSQGFSPARHSPAWGSLFLLVSGHTQQCAGITPAGLRRPCRVSGIKHRAAGFASTFPAAPLLRPNTLFAPRLCTLTPACGTLFLSYNDPRLPLLRCLELSLGPLSRQISARTLIHTPAIRHGPAKRTPRPKASHRLNTATSLSSERCFHRG